MWHDHYKQPTPATSIARYSLKQLPCAADPRDSLANKQTCRTKFAYQHSQQHGCLVEDVSLNVRDGARLALTSTWQWGSSPMCCAEASGSQYVF